MKKKLLALALVLVFVLGTVATGFAATLPDVVGTDFEDEVNRLVALDIISGFPDGTYKPEELVTRAQFAKIVVTATGVGAAAEYAKGATKFTDVAADHWAAGYINVATDLGIIQGYGDGRFGPEDQVTYAQAITMIVRALGYEPAAQAKGGFPGGYLAVAAENDITDGVTVLANVAANRGDIAIMVDNALEVEMMVQSSYGDKPTWEVKEGETLLKKLGVKEVKGNVVEIARVNDKLDDKEIKVEIDEKTTKTYELVSKDNPEALFGLAVKLLVKNSKAVHVEIDTDAADVLVDTVTGSEDEDYDIYLTVKDKDYKWLRDEEEVIAEVYVNFELVDAESLGGTYYGTVILDGKEIKFANLFEFVDGGLVTEVAKDEIEYVLLGDGDEDALLLDEYDDVYIYNKDFTAATLDDIDENSVIYYWEDGDDAVFIVVVNEAVEGEVTRARTDRVTVDGKNYDYGEDAIWSKDAGKKFAIAEDATDLVDEEVAIYLDLNGDVAAIVTETDVTSDTLYGIATWFEEARKPVVTIFTAEGKEVEYYFEDKAVDAGKVSGVADNYPDCEFVSYELNSDGEIAKGKLEAVEDSCTLEKDADKKYVEDATDRYYITKDTVIMKVYDGTDFDPAVIKYEDLVKMELSADPAIVVGDEGKNAKFIVFTGTNFEGVKDDIYFGVVTDSPWKVGSNWKAEVDVFGEGKAEFKIAEKAFAKGYLVAFKLDSNDKVAANVYAKLDGTEGAGAVGLADKDAELVSAGTVEEVDGSFITLAEGGTYKVLDGAVLYKVKYDDVKEEFKLDGTIRLSRIKADDEIILLLDKNKEVKAALVNPATNTNGWVEVPEP